MDPLTILGGIQTCASLAQGLYDLVQTIRHYTEDADDLILNFEYDNLMLENFIEFFKEHEQDIALNVRTLVSKATKSLEAKLDDTYKRLALHRHNNFRGRATWVLTKSKLTEAVQDHTKWVTQMNLLLANLPKQLLANLFNKFASDEYGEGEHPLSALLANVEMRKQRLQNMHASLAVFAALKRDDPGYGDTTKIIRPDIIPVPQAFLNKESETAEVELEVARLTSVLQIAEAEAMHTPKALAYFPRMAEVGGKQRPYQFGIAYDTPRSTACVKSLKAIIQEGKAFVALPLYQSLSHNMLTGT